MGYMTREPTLKTHTTFVHTDAGFNTPLGHCRKTEAILEYFGKHYQQNNWRWLVIIYYNVSQPVLYEEKIIREN